MSMKKEGMVSLWLGDSESFDRLNSFLKIEFSEDGDPLGSEFSRELGLEYIDEDFSESECVGRTHSLGEALDGFSYNEIIAPRFIDKVGEILDKEINAVILLYNFEYLGMKSNIVRPGITLQFIGSLPYT